MIRFLLLTLIARPLARFMTGADVIGAEHLPKSGPAIIAANHNSHVDTLLLLTMFPARLVPLLRPDQVVGALVVLGGSLFALLG